MPAGQPPIHWRKEFSLIQPLDLLVMLCMARRHRRRPPGDLGEHAVRLLGLWLSLLDGYVCFGGGGAGFGVSWAFLQGGRRPVVQRRRAACLLACLLCDG